MEDMGEPPETNHDVEFVRAFPTLHPFALIEINRGAISREQRGAGLVSQAARRRADEACKLAEGPLRRRDGSSAPGRTNPTFFGLSRCASARISALFTSERAEQSNKRFLGRLDGFGTEFNELSGVVCPMSAT
jgi:hypothetical protein